MTISVTQVDEAMELKGLVTVAEAARRVGVSSWTVNRWWKGDRDPYHASRSTGEGRMCRRGHLVTGDNAIFRPSRSPECAECRRGRARAHARERADLQFIEEEPTLRYSAASVLQAISDYGARLDGLVDADRKYIAAMRSGEVERVTVTRADRMFIRLGLHISLIEEEPS